MADDLSKRNEPLTRARRLAIGIAAGKAAAKTPTPKVLKPYTEYDVIADEQSIEDSRRLGHPSTAAAERIRTYESRPGAPKPGQKRGDVTLPAPKKPKR